LVVGLNYSCCGARMIGNAWRKANRLAEIRQAGCGCDRKVADDELADDVEVAAGEGDDEAGG